MKKRGISLIVLVITIIVMIILATAIILAISGSDVRGKATESVYKSDIATMKEKLNYIKSEIIVELPEGESLSFTKEQKEKIIPEKYRNNFDIDETGELNFIGNPFSIEAQWAKEVKVQIYYDIAYEIEDKLSELIDLAKDYISDGNSTKNANQLALQYIRRNRYNSSNWIIFAGSIDTNFVSYVDANKTQSLDVADFKDPVTGYEIDFVHSMASLNVYLEGEKSNLDDYACWFGDLVTVTEEIYNYDAANDLTRDELKAYSLKMIGSTDISSSFGISDMLADIDACNISKLCKTGDDLAEVLINYYFADYSNICKNRYNNFKAYIEEMWILFKSEYSYMQQPWISDVEALSKNCFYGNDICTMFTKQLLTNDDIPTGFFNLMSQYFAEYIEAKLEK